MHRIIWIEEQGRRSYDRLLPRLTQHFAAEIDRRPEWWQQFITRLEENFPRLFELLYQLYGDQYDFFYHLEAILQTAATMWFARPADLKTLDVEREANPTWFQSEEMIGGVCYVDLFADDLAGIKQKIPYFKELGLTYLHLMPLFRAPEENSDGGYAVSSYREVNPSLGTMTELADLAKEFRKNGISLVLDFVFNHTSNEHQWAERALAGDPEYQDFYWLFDDRTMPDQYQEHLRDIFPDRGSGSFTYLPDEKKWVWTTFYTFQWDLNYHNPAVFNQMLEEMLFLANTGVEILRLDAVAFIWKKLGTSCENLPEAHLIIQAYNALARIAAPALLFKSEAIVHPDDIVKYVSPGECQLSYNPLLMVLIWDALATRKVDHFNLAMHKRFALPDACSWVNYARCHDDIGWTFADEDLAQLGMNGFDHRRFLNSFYTGRFLNSFALGLPFQENPRTGDARISGMLASLAGLEKGLVAADDEAIDLAISRILLIHSIVLSMGGIPLIYLGDEIGMLNDYSFRDDLAKVHDSRWVHRPAADWAESMPKRHQEDTVEGRIFSGITQLINLRKQLSAIAGGDMLVLNTGNIHVFGYVRTSGKGRLIVLANFTEQHQSVAANEVRLYGLGYQFMDLIAGQLLELNQALTLQPYQVMWLIAQNEN